MINSLSDMPVSEKSMYIAACQRCLEERDSSNSNLNDIIDKIVLIFGTVILDKTRLRNFLQEEVTGDAEPIISVIAEELKNENWWNQQKKEQGFNSEYWNRYYCYLIEKESWSLSAVHDIDDATNKVMNVISNPKHDGEEERMGMVFGHVQSGKTAHYIGLINKSIDAGYKIIIVLSGIHNSLRSQTQSRIDEEVLGYETSLEMQGEYLHVKNAIGVGKDKRNKITETYLQSLTTRDEKGDFNAKIAGTSIVPPLIIITKKNATILRRIIKYFQKSPYADAKDSEKYVSTMYPALIIDDEADQASLNTKECYDDAGNPLPDFNPTTINGLIRKLLRLFDKRAYVGYTATPYANIFVPPYYSSDEFGKDLYPRDFIQKIPRAEKYIGAREFFGLTGEEESSSMPLYRNIEVGEKYLEKGTKQSDTIGELPIELCNAIKSFIISTAIRNCRGQTNKPNTMLVHIIRFVSQQNIIKKKIEKYFKEEIENRIIYNDQSIEEEFNNLWSSDYIKTTDSMMNNFPRYMEGVKNVDWKEVYAEIVRIVSENEIKIYSINGKSTDTLMYKANEGRPFNVIVVGGDKLSRGLTLEGLTISYFTRSSSTYDTLMQMGRWFGYRPGYPDMCRLYTTKTLNRYFLDISMATEELAHQFDFMNDMNQTPMTFGLRVATHPELMISSKNKIRTGQEMKKEFSNHLSQTRSFDVDPEQYDRNFAAVELFLNIIGTHRESSEYWEEKHREPIGKHYFWTGVSGYDTSNFFEAYETSRHATRANSSYMADYIRNQIKSGGVINWTVCLINVGEERGIFEITGIPVGSGIERIKGFTPSGDTCSIHTMTSKDHEYLDYTHDQMEEVDSIRDKDAPSKENTIAEEIREKTRSYKNGLLILYPIGSVIPLNSVQGTHKTPFGFAAVFPSRKDKGELKSYRVTEIGIARENYELFD